MAGMVTINGVRYRVEDAVRLGLMKPNAAAEPARKSRTPRNQAKKPANK